MAQTGRDRNIDSHGIFLSCAAYTQKSQIEDKDKSQTVNYLTSPSRKWQLIV